MKRQRGTCTIEGCVEPHHARGWCKRHWQRWKTHGTPFVPMGPPQSRDPEGKWNFIRDAASAAGDVSSPCIDWLWSLTTYGYPQMFVDGKKRVVTHLVLETSGRPRPSAPQDYALHSCDRRRCIAPYHLRWGTNAENMAEMVERGRHRDWRTGMPSGGAFCQRGHRFDDDPFINSAGRRECRECRRLTNRWYAARTREAATS